jgi:hypothetical protein
MDFKNLSSVPVSPLRPYQILARNLLRSYSSQPLEFTCFPDELSLHLKKRAPQR